jgi:hypothetical protein
MSLHKLTAGSGYNYLTRQVAALDATTRAAPAWRRITPNGVSRRGCGSVPPWRESMVWMSVTR